MKIKIAEQLHDKVLYADADMNNADWQTGLATAVGVAGVGLGLRWFDAAAALFVGGKEHPVIRTETHALTCAWVSRAGARIRAEGHVFHTEMFVVPVPELPAEVHGGNQQDKQFEGGRMSR